MLATATRSTGLLALLLASACVDPDAVCGWLEPEPLAVEQVVDLHAIDGNLAVGDDGAMISASDGSARIPEPDARLRAISTCAIATSCASHAVGLGGVAVSDASGSWAPLELGTDRDLFDVARVDGQVIVVGDELLRVWNELEGPAVAFDPVPPAGIWGILRDYAGGVVVGDGGAIYTSDDLHEWTTVDSGTTDDLLALGFVDRDPFDQAPSELWAVGRAGTVLARRAGGWERLDYALSTDLLDFDAGFAITSDRRVLRLLDAGEVELVATFDRQPRALEAGFFSAAEPSITVVGDAGLFVTITGCE